jgi:hypothetical protein
MQIDVSQAREELRQVASGGGGKGFNDFLDNLGLGIIAQQLKELDLGELMDTPPPGIDEAIAISKVKYVRGRVDPGLKGGFCCM